MAEQLINVKIQVTGIDNMVAELQRIDKELVKELKKEMAQAIRPTAAMIKARIPTSDRGRILSGMLESASTGASAEGRTRWSPVRATIKFFPRPRKAGYGVKPLLGIDITGSPGGLGFDYAELAGASKRSPRSRTKEFSRRTRTGQTVTYTRKNNHGDQFIRDLKAKVPSPMKAGRYAYAVFRDEKPRLEAKAQVILDKYAAKTSRRIGTR